MSQNIFQINPIFFMPIDLEENSKISSETEEDSQKSIEDIEKKNENYKNKINNEDETTNEYSSSGKDLDQTLHINEINKEKINKKEKKGVLIFSVSVNDPHIKSMTNSSKIYMSEIFKQNWKLKSRRLITKLKKKLIKQYNNSCKEGANYNNNNENNINFKHNIYSNKNININNQLCECNNSLLNHNYINNNNICNNFNGNNLVYNRNSCTIINNNFNQYNNYNIINSICNNEIDHYNHLLKMQCNGY